MHINKGRYSKYINPILILIDLCFIISLTILCYSFPTNEVLLFLTYQIGSWMIIAYFLKTYEVYRFTTLVEILNRLMLHFVIFSLCVLSFFTVFKIDFVLQEIAYNIGFLFVFVSLFKFLFYYYIKRYRIETKKNIRHILLVGDSKELEEFRKLLNQRKDIGYNILNTDKIKIQDSLALVRESHVDEIFCSIGEFENRNIQYFTDLAEDYKINIKIIPEYKYIFAKKMHLHYIDHLPILTITRSPLDTELSKFFKRVFDIIFSLLVIVFVLSWLIPILGILIKIESSGPIFFKQSRPGIYEQEFFCIKFRSMRPNKTTEKEASRNDPRVTKIGRFIRKTSLDEMPQFLNVLLGDMSVVGPRPHLWTQNKVYGPKVKKYMSRHQVKPGITGLAQVRGFRGEIETDADMINRIKYDNFYIENWSILLDIKIIIQTVINIFKGEEKAY